MIEEFRANGGKVGGPHQGAKLLLLTTRGAKSGRPHTTPLGYLPDGERLIVFGTKAGAPTNPDWYYNLLAQPTATVEVGVDSFAVTSSVLKGDERARLFGRQATLRPQFAEYEAKTTREIPVVALERLASGSRNFA